MQLLDIDLPKLSQNVGGADIFLPHAGFHRSFAGVFGPGLSGSAKAIIDGDCDVVGLCRSLCLQPSLPSLQGCQEPPAFRENNECGSKLNCLARRGVWEVKFMNETRIKNRFYKHV